MSAEEAEWLDQALFGYADGHRQIASSIRLPSRDLYQLSAASDLASGALLKSGESYLTGLPLTESKKYALIRTWAAPEMPRPGCVWSHALIIDFRYISSRNDLSDFLSLFTSPGGRDAQEYSQKLIGPPPGDFSQFAPDVEVVRKLLWSYYETDVGLIDGALPPDQREAAVIAVWSQQWPKLRIGFSFRTAVSQERRRSDTTQFDVQMRSMSEPSLPPPEQDNSPWLQSATVDATSRVVTPLRRFLWRYGRDVQAARRMFPWLVTLYDNTKSLKTLSVDEARAILNTFPETNDGSILKRDAFGIGSGTLPLISSLSASDFFTLAAENREFPATDVDRRLADITASDIIPLARLLEQNSLASDVWSGKIIDRFVEVADSPSILEEELPPKIRSAILNARPDLIDDQIAKKFSDRALKDLVLLHGDDAFISRIADVVVSRDFGLTSEQLLNVAPIAISKAAVGIAREGKLSRSWLQSFLRLSSRLPLDAIFHELPTTTDVMCAISLFRLSPRSAIEVSEWASLLSRVSDNSVGETRVDFNAFILVSALTSHCDVSWQLIFRAYPTIKAPVIEGRLPNGAYQWLSNELPRFHTAQYWDINKRIILSIARLNQSYPYNGSFSDLHLTTEELHWFEFGLLEEDDRSKNRFWWF